MSIATNEQVDLSGPPTRVVAVTASEIRRAQGAFRDAIVDFLGQPSTVSFGAMHRQGLEYLEFERERLLPATTRALVDATGREKLLEQHFTLLQRLNTVVADIPGTEQLRDDAHALRHALLAQVDLCEQSLCRGRPLRLES